MIEDLSELREEEVRADHDNGDEEEMGEGAALRSLFLDLDIAPLENDEEGEPQLQDLRAIEEELEEVEEDAEEVIRALDGDFDPSSDPVRRSDPPGRRGRKTTGRRWRLARGGSGRAARSGAPR
jgi:hypothetical protein